MKEAASPTDPRAARLRLMKRVALAALLCALGLLVLAEWHGRQGIWGWIGAFGEAATIGAVADWFAVVALFRHPLGLPIPHTAIIPRNRARIADALARFVGENFLEREHLIPRIEAWNPARKLGEFLATPERLDALSRQLQRWAAQSLSALDSPEFEREILGIVQRQLQAWNAAQTASQMMQALTRGQHHQQVLNAGLVQVANWLEQPNVRGLITQKIVAMARREFPKLTWVTDKLDSTEALGEAVAKRLANAIVDEVDDVLREPDHPLRLRYSEETAKLVARLEDDPELQAKVAEWKQQLLDSPVLQDYVRQLWARLRAWLHADLAREDSVAMTRFRSVAEKTGLRLRDDPLWQATANEQFSIAAYYFADQLRSVAPRYIRDTVESWDTQFLVDEVERTVGRDLQYIRLNGTLIGGLAGVVLYAVFQWLSLH